VGEEKILRVLYLLIAHIEQNTLFELGWTISFSSSFFSPELPFWEDFSGGHTELSTQSFTLAKQVLYHFSHTSSSFCSGYFGDGVS
jgi:hypothetical protein